MRVETGLISCHMQTLCLESGVVYNLAYDSAVNTRFSQLPLCFCCRLSCLLVYAAAGGNQLEGCLLLVEAQMLALSDRPYAPTARPTQTLLLVSALVEVLDPAHSIAHMTGVYASTEVLGVSLQRCSTQSVVDAEHRSVLAPQSPNSTAHA